MMVSIKEAAANALAFAEAALGPERTTGARLEEVESTQLNGKDVWLITLSLKKPVSEFVIGKRDYKTFTILKETGDVTAMKIRELADA